MLKQNNSDVVIDQAIGLIRRRGHRCATLPGQAANPQFQNLYQHRSTKEITLQRSLAQITYTFWESCLAPAYDDSLNYQESWRAMIDRIETYFSQHRSCVMAQLLLDGFDDYPTTQTRLNVFFVNWRDAFAHVLAARYGHEQARIIAVDAIAQLEGALVTLPLFADASPLVRACSSLRELM